MLALVRCLVAMSIDRFRSLISAALVLMSLVSCAVTERVYDWHGASRLADHDLSMVDDAIIDVQWWIIWQDNPVWRIVVVRDGSVTETIEKRGEMKRTLRGKLDSNTIETLLHIALEEEFLELDQKFECSEEDVGRISLGIEVEGRRHIVVVDGPYDEWCGKCTPEIRRFARLWNAFLLEVPPSSRRRHGPIWLLPCGFLPRAD